jgi:hypothetical protein
LSFQFSCFFFNLELDLWFHWKKEPNYKVEIKKAAACCSA